MVLFHHDPSRTDDQLDGIEAGQSRAGVPVEAARQGRVFELPADADVGSAVPVTMGEVTAS